MNTVLPAAEKCFPINICMLVCALGRSWPNPWSLVGDTYTDKSRVFRLAKYPSTSAESFVTSRI